ncbi:spermidine resistance protein [Salix suchowensis]|nr:spermidine resistance protein [Salix suchowensis]
MPESAAASAPFEGPEKLLEIWFAPSASDVPDASDPTEDGRQASGRSSEKSGRKCSILSGAKFFLLSTAQKWMPTSSVFHEHRVPCLLFSQVVHVPRTPARPHRDWKQEVEFLDGIFQNGAAYTVGKVNGDHWLLYMTIPDTATIPASPSPPLARHVQDSTIEILMSDLASPACQPFHYDQSLSTSDPSPSSHAQQISAHLGISDIFPPHLTVLDGYSFSPCGYSCNALIKWARPKPSNSPVLTSQAQEGEGYYTIHVTPEEGWSYASFECNIPLSHLSPSDPTPTSAETMPDLVALVQRVVRIFQPGRLSLTLFISSQDNENETGRAPSKKLNGLSKRL